ASRGRARSRVCGRGRGDVRGRAESTADQGRRLWVAVPRRAEAACREDAVAGIRMSRPSDPASMHSEATGYLRSLCARRVFAAGPHVPTSNLDDEVDPCPRTALSPAMSPVPGT